MASYVIVVWLCCCEGRHICVDTEALVTSPECSTPIALASVISASLTALLATVVFVLVQIAVCKCHPKFSSGPVASAGGEGQAVYEQVDGGEGDVAVSTPTYMEVGAGGGGNTLELKSNEAYGAFAGN